MFILRLPPNRPSSKSGEEAEKAQTKKRTYFRHLAISLSHQEVEYGKIRRNLPQRRQIPASNRPK